MEYFISLYILITDNDPQFASHEFKVFAKLWMFEYTISNARYLQTKGKSEHVVHMYKALLTKAHQSRNDPLLALLGYRNTRSEGSTTSPAQRFMGHRTRTLLPTAEELFQPKIDTETAVRLSKQKKMQASTYDTGTKTRTSLQVGQAVRMSLPGERKWTLGRCRRVLNNNSNEVDTNVKKNHRNHRHLRASMEFYHDHLPPDDIEDSLANADAASV